MDKITALDIIHNPTYSRKLQEAIIRSKYEELFLFMLKINMLRRNNNIQTIGHSKDIPEMKINDFKNKLTFSLTNDQLDVLDKK